MSPFFEILRMCLMQVSAETALQISGYCEKCRTVHSLKSEMAVPYCMELMKILEREKRIDFEVPHEQADEVFSTDYLFGSARGQMFGVMLYHDQKGELGTVRAFSGQYNSRWNAPGWVSPVIDEDEFIALTSKTERKIKALGREMSCLEQGSDQYRVLAQSRKDLSRGLMREIHTIYTIHNFHGDKGTMPEIATTSGGLPTGTGDCCAPKLLNYAALNRLTPISIAEFYFGKENRSRTKKHKEFYSSCIDKCGLILGFMLCGI